MPTALKRSFFAFAQKAPYFASEVIGGERLDELGGAIFAGHDPAAVLHDRLTQELSVTDGGASLPSRWPLISRPYSESSESWYLARVLATDSV